MGVVLFLCIFSFSQYTMDNNIGCIAVGLLLLYLPLVVFSCAFVSERVADRSSRKLAVRTVAVQFAAAQWGVPPDGRPTA